MEISPESNLETKLAKQNYLLAKGTAVSARDE